MSEKDLHDSESDVIEPLDFSVEATELLRLQEKLRIEIAEIMVIPSWIFRR